MRRSPFAFIIPDFSVFSIPLLDKQTKTWYDFAAIAIIKKSVLWDVYPFCIVSLMRR